MSETAQNIVQCFDQMRGFCRNVAILLSTCDTVLGDNGWQPQGGSRYVTDRSDSSSYPHKWIPAGFGRLYLNDVRPNVLAFVCVLVGRYDDPSRIKQALLSAGYFEYEEDSVVGNRWDYWFARWHSWMPDRTDNGEWCLQQTEKLKKDHDIERVRTFALPLDEVTSGGALKEKVVDRLLANIAEEVKAVESRPA